MSVTGPNSDADRAEIGSGHQPLGEPGSEQARAWEQIEEGRYMPRRICGSHPGRELG